MTTPADDGAVRITLRDVYAAVQETHEVVVQMRSDVSASKERGDDHETRIRAVERRVWALPSIATILAVAGIGISIVGVIHSYGP